MKIVGMKSPEVGDIFVVRKVRNYLFSKRIEIEKLRSGKEVSDFAELVSEMEEHADGDKRIFWRGIKNGLIWMMGTIEKK